jgi:hypothetical protein
MCVVPSRFTVGQVSMAGRDGRKSVRAEHCLMYRNVSLIFFYEISFIIFFFVIFVIYGFFFQIFIGIFLQNQILQVFSKLRNNLITDNKYILYTVRTCMNFFKITL